MLADGIKQTSTTAGSGPLTVANVTGSVPLASAFALNQMFAYSIYTGGDSAPAFREAGVGYLSAANTLVRARVSATFDGTTYNASSPSATDFGGAAITVICTPHAATLESMMPTVDGTSSNVIRDITSAGRSMATSNITVVALRVYYVPFLLKTAAPITAMSIYVATAGAAGTTARAGIYACKADGSPGSLLVQAATDFDTSATGLKTASLSAPISLPPGWYFVAIVCSGTPSLVCYQTNSSQVMGGGPFGWNSTSAMVAYDSRYETVATAALPAAAGATTGANLGGAVSPMIPLRVA